MTLITKQLKYSSAHDVLDPNDPDAAETAKTRVEEPEENTKTLEEYLQEKKSSQIFRVQDTRKVDDADWKGAVVLEKEEDLYFAGKVNNPCFMINCIY